MNQYSEATTCIHGHEFTNENTYINPTSGARQCKVCMKERAKKNYKEKRYTYTKNYDTLTIDRLKELLEYDPNTGLWRWIILTNNRCKKGRFLGSLKTNPDGYQLYELTVDRTVYIASRLAWFYMTGNWPTNKIDHKDRDSLNNKWKNLREATNNQNTMNQTPRVNVTGYKGVHKNGKKYYANIRIDGIMAYLGKYDTAIEASYAYEAVAIPLHGEFWFLHNTSKD